MASCIRRFDLQAVIRHEERKTGYVFDGCFIMSLSLPRAIQNFHKMHGAAHRVHDAMSNEFFPQRMKNS